MELHLEIVGKMTADMYVAALLDAFPDYEDAVIEAVDAVTQRHPLECRLEYVRERGIRGQRLIIEPYTRYFGHLLAAPQEQRESWSALRETVLTASLTDAVRKHSLSLLMLIARHQAAHRDIVLEAVSFPRNEAWQMMADVVAAAVMIDGLGRASWAALASQAEFATPVGRAILAFIGALPDLSEPQTRVTGRTVLRSGLGFAGQSKPSAANYLRVDCYDELRMDIPRSGSNVIPDGDHQGGRG